MNIIFLHHSSFLVELEHNILIFDYFQGDRVDGYCFRGKLPEFDNRKNIYVFSSHKHRDHFDMDNLKLEQKYDKVQFIFSKDCKMSRNFLKKHGYPEVVMEHITYVTPDMDYQVGEVAIHTLKSTDAGVAFCVKAEGRNIYHAGDLNWWHWEGETLEENKKMEKAFKHEIAKIEKEHFDVAFVPLDSRQAENAFWGFDFFIRNVDADCIFPMHMWQDYTLIKKYKKDMLKTDESKSCTIMEILRENQVFHLLTINENIEENGRANMLQ